MIEIKNVSKWYRLHHKKIVLKNINLTFPSRSFISIMGDSGSGKSTLIKLISGIEKPSKGKIFFFGKRLNKRNRNKLRALDIGIILQGNNLNLDKTVYENIELPLRMINLKEKYERIEKINYILKALKLDDLKDKQCKNLSGGEQKRVELARALVKNPKVIIADEVTSSLDERNAKLVLDVLKSLSNEKLIIFITHNVKEATAYSKRIIYIKNGTIYKDIKNNKENKFIHNKINTDYLDNSLNDIKYSSIYKISELIIEVLKSLKNNSIKKRFLISLFISTSILYLSLCMLEAKKAYQIKNIYDKNYIRVITKDTSSLKSINSSYFIKGSSLKKVYIKRNDYYKINKPLISFKSVIKKHKEVKTSHVWIDKSLIELLFNDKKIKSLLKMSGINKDMKNTTIIINNIPFKIEKIVAYKSPSIYFNNNDFNRVLTVNNPYQNYDKYKDYITIISGRKPIYDGELLVNEHNVFQSSNIVGTYKENYDYIFVNKSTFEKKYYNTKEYSVYTKNKSQTINKLKKLKLTYIDDYNIMNKHIKRKQRKGLNKATKTLLYMLFTSLVINYFIIKSNLYNNSKKIKNYKLLGVKTSDIYKFFILENIIMNLIVLFIAIILINYFIFEIKQIEMFKHIFKVSLNNIINCLFISILSNFLLVILTIKKLKL